MAAVRAAKAKMDERKAVKKEMAAYIGLCNSDARPAELLGTAMAMTLELMATVADASGEPCRLNLATTSPAEKAWIGASLGEMLTMYQRNDLDALALKIKATVENKTYNGTFLLCSVIGSAGAYLNVETYTMELMSGPATVQQVAKIAATCVIADCTRLLNRLLKTC